MKILSVCLLLFLARADSISEKVITDSQASGWKQIRLLHSRRTDVEKLLGPPKRSAHVVTYSLETFTLFIEYYSFDHCKPRFGYSGSWNIPEWTVIEIKYLPSEPTHLSSLKLDLAQFRKVHESPDVPDLTSYRNEQEGVDYTVEPDGTLNSIRYFPAKREDGSRCYEAPKKPGMSFDAGRSQRGTMAYFR